MTVALAISATLAALVGLSQDPSPGVSAHEVEQAAQRRVRERNRSPDLDVRTGFVGSGIQLNAGSDSTSVSLSASRSWDGSAGDVLSFNTFSAVLTAPIDDKEHKEGAFLTEGGLPNSISLQGSFTMTFGRDPPTPGTPEERERLRTTALEHCLSRSSTEDARARCRASTYRQLDRTSRLVDPFVHTPIWFLGISGAIGTRNFEFRRLPDLGKDDVDRTEFSASVFAGVNPGDVPLYLGAGYEYRRQYKSLPSRTFCPAPGGTGPQECFTGSFGEPTENIDSSIFAVARYQGLIKFDEDASLPFGIALRVAYDTRDRVFGVGLPVYLFSDSTGLRGGFRVDWQDVDDADKRFGFRVFIGTPFNLFSGN